MAQYLTYEEYVGYGGTMPESEFPVAEFKARSRLDWITMGRVQHMTVVPEEVKLAMMVIINVDTKFSTDAQLESAIISSFTTDGYTETHGNFFEQVGLANSRVNSEVQKMLFGVLDDYGEPLIFRGLQ